MATIQKTIYAEKDLTVFTLSGPVSQEEIVDALLEYYLHSPTNLLLWNYSNADASSFKMEDLEAILESLVKFKEKRPKGKTALVASDDFAFGIGRMYDALVEINEYPREHRVFRSVDDAMKWLMEKD